MLRATNLVKRIVIKKGKNNNNNNNIANRRLT